jgi:hypothetical protein
MAAAGITSNFTTSTSEPQQESVILAFGYMGFLQKEMSLIQSNLDEKSIQLKLPFEKVEQKVSNGKVVGKVKIGCHQSKRNKGMPFKRFTMIK